MCTYNVRLISDVSIGCLFDIRQVYTFTLKQFNKCSVNTLPFFRGSGQIKTLAGSRLQLFAHLRLCIFQVKNSAIFRGCRIKYLKKIRREREREETKLNKLIQHK
jgi:hypothetical protein